MMSQNETYVLNPDYHFKSDKDRIVMYSKKQVSSFSSSDWVSFIHPTQAQILNVFAVKRTFGEQCKLLALKYGISEGQISEMLAPYIENKNVVHTIFKEKKYIFLKMF